MHPRCTKRTEADESGHELANARAGPSDESHSSRGDLVSVVTARERQFGVADALAGRTADE